VHIGTPKGGSLKEHSWHEPNDVMCLKVIRYGCEHCSRAVDLGMSLSSSGGATFKREWKDKDMCLEYRCVLNGVFEMSNISASNPKHDRPHRPWRCSRELGRHESR
jgi:hypothetical protein